MNKSLNKFILFLIILIITICFIILIKNDRLKKKENTLTTNEIDNQQAELINNENVNTIKQESKTKADLLEINDIKVNQFQFSQIGVLQINQNPMLHFIVSNNKNEKVENCNFRIDVYDDKGGLVDELYVCLWNIEPNQWKEMAVKLNVDEKIVKSIKIKEYKTSEYYTFE